jgi:L-threonylcarbamoyladenylate synthase
MRVTTCTTIIFEFRVFIWVFSYKISHNGPSMEESQFLSRCSEEIIRVAAQTLLEGKLVAFPTETVYGLGADATNADAVARIYEVKGRPADHPLIVHIHSMAAMEPWISDIPAYAISLARDFWPGPMTLILKRSSLAENFITGGQDSVGVRVPNNPLALSLLREFHRMGGKGVAAPSANRFGQVSATTSEAVRAELNKYLNKTDLILDGGKSAIGLESTIIDCTLNAPRILRPGAITKTMIQESLGINLIDHNDLNSPRVSGLLEKHYSPNARVVLDETPKNGQGYLALSKFPSPNGVVRLAEPENDEEFARVLYSSLRKADELGLDLIVIQQPLGEGIAVAIRDRALRASKGR